MICFRDVNGLLLCFQMSKVTATGRELPQPSSIKTGNENDEPKRLIKKNLDRLFVIGSSLFVCNWSCFSYGLIVGDVVFLAILYSSNQVSVSSDSIETIWSFLPSIQPFAQSSGWFWSICQNLNTSVISYIQVAAVCSLFKSSKIHEPCHSL